MKIAVVGAGAMGCLYGGALKEKGHDVTLVDVSPRQIEVINAEGLKLERNNCSTTVKIPAMYAHEVKGKVELIIIFTKTLYSEKALEGAMGFIGDETSVLTLQNGLGNVETIEKFVPRERIFVGVTNFPSDLLKPGCVSSHGQGQTKIMSADGKFSPQLEKVRTALDEAGFNCEIVPDVFVAIWEKVAFNAALNALSAATSLMVGSIGGVEEGRKLAYKIAGEAVDVANRKGVQAQKERVIKNIDGAFTGHGDHKPSMLQDVLAQRPTEINSINGAVVREAEQIGMSAPTTETLYMLVRLLEQSYGKQALK